MPSNPDPFEAELAAALRRAGPPAPPYLTPVIRKARRRIAARDILSWMLGRLWLALACFLAPLFILVHQRTLQPYPTEPQRRTPWKL